MSVTEFVDYLYERTAFRSLNLRQEHKPIFIELFDSLSNINFSNFVESLHRFMHNSGSFFFSTLLKINTSEELKDITVDLPFKYTPVFLDYYSESDLLDPNSSLRNPLASEYHVILFIFALYELNEYQPFLSTIRNFL